MKVLRINKDFGDEFAIVWADDIEKIRLRETYDRYGIKRGAGFLKVNVINYYDGSNYRTLFVGDNQEFGADLDYIEKKQEQEIISLYEKLRSVDFEDCGAGMKSCEKGGYEFILSSWEDDSWNVVRVKEI